MYYVKLLLKEYTSKYPLDCNLTDDEYFDIIEDYIIQELDSLCENSSRQTSIKTQIKQRNNKYELVDEVLDCVRVFMEDHLQNPSRSRICIACRGSSVVLALALYGSKVFEILDCYSNNIGSKLKSEFKEYTTCTNKNIDIVMYRVFINYDFNNERHKLYNKIINACCKLLKDNNCFKQPILNLFARDFLNGQLQNIDFVKDACNNSESGARKAHVFIFKKEFPTPKNSKKIYIKMQFPTEKRNSFGGAENPKTHTININFDSNYLKLLSLHRDGISDTLWHPRR